MTKSARRAWPIFALSAVVSGCSGGVLEDSSKATASDCTFIHGGGTEVSYTFPGGSLVCTFSNLDQAADGEPATAGVATATFVWGPSVNGTPAGPVVGESDCAVRVTAQPGLVFPGGNVAGALIELTLSGADAPALDGNGHISVRTYLNGEVQEETEPPSVTVAVNGTGGTTGTIGLQTTKPFDAVELFFGNVAEHQTLQIREFCSDIRE